MSILIANVGNRDLLLNIGSKDAPRYVTVEKGEKARLDTKELKRVLIEEWGKLGNSQEPPCGRVFSTRSFGATVHDLVDCVEDRLLMPILGPVLTKCGDGVERVVLICTAQDDQKSGGHSEWDTYECARVMQHLLEKRRLSVLLRRVRKNPSGHDHAFQMIDNLLNDPAAEVGDTDEVYAAIRGGIPALNSALAQHVIARFGPRAHLVEVDEPPDIEQRKAGVVGQARLVDTWPIRRQQLIRQARVLLDRFDFEGARLLLEHEGVDDKTVLVYLRHGHARQNLDMAAAAEFNEGIPEDWRCDPAVEWSSQRLRDVADAAGIAYDRADYLTYLALVSTFRENLLRVALFASGWQLGGLYKIPETSLGARLVSCLQRTPCQRLTENNVAYWVANVPFLVAVTRHKLRSRATDLVACVEKLQQAGKLRNETLHNMRGVAKKQVDTAMDAETFLALAAAALQTIAGLDGQRPPICVIHAIRGEVLERLTRHRPGA